MVEWFGLDSESKINSMNEHVRLTLTIIQQKICFFFNFTLNNFYYCNLTQEHLY